MKKIILTLLLMLSNILMSQNLSFVYELRYKPDLTGNSLTKKIFILDVLGKESVFRSEQERRSDSLKQRTGFGTGQSVIYSDQIYIQKDLTRNRIIKSVTTPFIKEDYFITISEPLEWNIVSEKQKIGEYDTQKATVYYGGRNWTAWFTSHIPIQEGPYIFHGLPGLIVKISDEKAEYDFNLISTRNSSNTSLFILKKGREITWDNLKKLQLDYYTDPSAPIKSTGARIKIVDPKGNEIKMDTRNISQNIKKRIRDQNNSIELDRLVIYE